MSRASEQMNVKNSSLSVYDPVNLVKVMTTFSFNIQLSYSVNVVFTGGNDC